MTSLSRLHEAMTPGEGGRPPVLSPEMLRDSLGKIGLNPAERLLAELGGAASPLSAAGLEDITNPEIKQQFERDLASYKTIFAGAGITMPTPEELTLGGLDFARLAELKETHPDHDLVVTPLTLPLDKVRQLVAAVTNDKSIPGNPLESPSEQIVAKNDGLLVYKDVVINWSQIMQSTESRWQLPTTAGEQRWTAFLLPGGAKPENLGASYAEMKQQDIVMVPIVGYIAYQMCRIRQSLQPVDFRTWTWAEGEFAISKDTAQAPRVDWDADGGRVYVGWRGVGGSDVYLGLRSPVG